MVPAFYCLRGSAAFKYYLSIKLSGFYLVCLKKAYRQKGYLFNFIHTRGCFSKGIYIGLVNLVGPVLKMKNIQRKLHEALFCHRKYFIMPFTIHYRLVSG